MLRSLHKLVIKIWWAWFYTLAAMQTILYFPFLVIILMLPRGYAKLFWIARNLWSRIILHGSGFYLSFEDQHKLKTETNCLLIANHTSYMDIFLMFILNKTPFTFVGKKELYSIPIFGYIYKRAAILVDRSNSKSRYEVYGRANKLLEEGYNICIFPETNYLDETAVLADFKHGAFKIAIENKLPIIPIVMFDCKLKFPWYPIFGKPGQLRAKVLDKIEVNDLTEEDIPELIDKTRKIMKDELLADPKKAPLKAANKYRELHKK